MNFLQKIREQPILIKKIIFWVLIVFISLCLLFWWLKIAQRRVETFKKENIMNDINISVLKEKLDSTSSVQLKEDFQKLEGELGELQILLEEEDQAATGTNEEIIKK